MSSGESTKLQPKFRGPMVVTTSKPGDTYLVTALSKESGRTYATTAHISQLKIYNPRRSDLTSDESEVEDKEQSEQDESGEEEDEKADQGKAEREDADPVEVFNLPTDRLGRQRRRPRYLDEFHC